MKSEMEFPIFSNIFDVLTYITYRLSFSTSDSITLTFPSLNLPPGSCFTCDVLVVDIDLLRVQPEPWNGHGRTQHFLSEDLTPSHHEEHS